VGRTQRVGENWYIGDRGHAVRVIMFVAAKLEPVERRRGG
jgi:hypothetical protein